MNNIATLAATSAVRFTGMARAGTLHRVGNRLGERYRIDQGGTYEIFRETVGTDDVTDPPGVLVVGFRLRLISSNPVAHWLFQRLCILTTPFWSGFRGFRVKLWMVEPETKDYLGIYQWAGEENARAYVEALVRVLRPLSAKGSVWYKQYPNEDFETFLRARKQ
jgi:hypothetical protein